MREFTFFSALSSFLADLRNVLSNTRILRVEWFSTSIKVCFLYSFTPIINPADSVFDSGRKFHYLLEVVSLCEIDALQIETVALWGTGPVAINVEHRLQTWT
jgi:hypothetical protein